jgi:hypothetical protein
MNRVSTDMQNTTRKETQNKFEGNILPESAKGNNNKKISIGKRRASRS